MMHTRDVDKKELCSSPSMRCAVESVLKLEVNVFGISFPGRCKFFFTVRKVTTLFFEPSVASAVWWASRQRETWWHVFCAIAEMLHDCWTK